LIWWEDFKVGEAADLGQHTFSEDEIVAFARQFDPQPFHIDKVAAQQSVFGGLIASGWHTCAVGMRLLCESLVNNTVSLGSPGATRSVTGASSRATRASMSRKGVGLVKHRWEAVNQRGELVLTMEGWGFFGRKD